MANEFEVITVLQGPVDQRKAIGVKPTMLYIFPTGSKSDRPSFGIYSENNLYGFSCVGQVTFQMIFDNMDDSQIELLEKEWQRMKEEKIREENLEAKFNAEKRES